MRTTDGSADPAGRGLRGALDDRVEQPVELTAEVQFRPVGDVAVGFTPTARHRMYMYCLFPIDEGPGPGSTRRPALISYEEPGLGPPRLHLDVSVKAAAC